MILIQNMTCSPSSIMLLKFSFHNSFEIDYKGLSISYFLTGMVVVVVDQKKGGEML